MICEYPFFSGEYNVAANIYSCELSESHEKPGDFDRDAKFANGVRWLLAGWGYNTVQQCDICHELNLELVDLQQFNR